MASPILKVSVRVSGAVLLDGEPVSLGGLGAKLDGLKPDRPVVWYHREAADGEPPAEAMQVMKLVVDKQVPISLSSKADFSDYVDRKGVSHPRYATWDEVIAKVREMTAGGRYAGIIRPDRSYLLIAPPSKDSMPANMVQMMAKLVPPQPPRWISAIADTYFSWRVGGGVPTLAEAAQAIPFFGMLLGLACVGHSVCVFTGTDDSMAAGCRGTDLLIVDDAQLPALSADWKKVAAPVMRNANIVAHERASFKLKAI
jgi:hypothetical protein